MPETNGRVTLALLKHDVEEIKTLVKEHDERNRQAMTEVQAMFRIDHDTVTRHDTKINDIAGDVKDLRSSVNLRTWGLGSIALILSALAGFLGLKQ